MHLAPEQHSLFDQYLDAFQPLIGDQRTGHLFRGTVQGIIAAESLVCARIAAFSPSAGQRQQRRPTHPTHG